MEMPSSEDSRVMTDVYGLFHSARLEAAGAVVATIQAAFAVAQTRLEGAHDARVELEKSVVRAEAMRVESETTVEASLRSIDLTVLAASRRQRTAEPYVSTFPKGVTGAIEPRGRAQLAEGLRIANHLAPIGGTPPEGVTGNITAEVATLRENLADFERTLSAEDSVHVATAAAFNSELAARRAWREQYRKDHGLLTAQFGQDKRKVESFFKRPPKARQPGKPA